MNDLPVIGNPYLHKTTLDRQLRGQILQVARRKCITRSCVYVQKTILEKDQYCFALVLSQKNLDSVDMSDMWKM